jgi:hypothetical protein
MAVSCSGEENSAGYVIQHRFFSFFFKNLSEINLISGGFCSLAAGVCRTLLPPEWYKIFQQLGNYFAKMVS